MATKSLKDISLDGLWKNNPALVQLLGLCPLLAVTGSVVNALGLGLATMMVLVGSNLSVSLIRNPVSDAVRLPAFVMIIASFVTVAELTMQAFTYELYEVLGIFIPLIVTNCAILGRADAFASKNPILPSVVDGVMMAIGFTVVLVLLGALREVLGGRFSAIWNSYSARQPLTGRLFWLRIVGLSLCYSAAGRICRHGSADRPQEPD